MHKSCIKYICNCVLSVLLEVSIFSWFSINVDQDISLLFSFIICLWKCGPITCDWTFHILHAIRSNYESCTSSYVRLVLFVHYHTGATPFTNSYFGIGFRPHFMQVTSCLGTESNLLSCSGTSLGFKPGCNATNEVGVRCIGMCTAMLQNKYCVSYSILLIHRSFKCMYSWGHSIGGWQD